MSRRYESLLLVGLAAVVALALLRHLDRGPELSPLRASWRLTPGVLNPDVTQVTIRSTICVRGWTRTVRPPVDYTTGLKVEQMRRYRRAGGPDDYQEDHLISLELGGHPTDPRNLWPEPRPHAEEVDQLENELNRRVCSGELTLAEAQRQESHVKHTTG
jgi:hypothetical protein